MSSRPLWLFVLLAACGNPHDVTGVVDPAAAHAVPPAAQNTPADAVPVPAGAPVGTLVAKSGTRTVDAAIGSVRDTIHAANAASVAMELPPTTVFAVVSAETTFDLLKVAPSLALDLPAKVLVYQDGDVVRVVRTDPYALARRHGLTGQEALLDALDAELTALVRAAAGSHQDG